MDEHILCRPWLQNTFSLMAKYLRSSVLQYLVAGSISTGRINILNVITAGEFLRMFSNLYFIEI